MTQESGILWALVVNPLAVGLTAAGGVAVCAAAGWHWQVHEMLVAGGALLAASELAMVPLIFTSKRDQIAVSQAALIATMIHLFIAAAAMFALKSSIAFHAWLVAFYGMTMISVVAACIRAVRAAPDRKRGKLQALG